MGFARALISSSSNLCRPSEFSWSCMGDKTLALITCFWFQYSPVTGNWNQGINIRWFKINKNCSKRWVFKVKNSFCAKNEDSNRSNKGNWSRRVPWYENNETSRTLGNTKPLNWRCLYMPGSLTYYHRHTTTIGKEALPSTGNRTIGVYKTGIHACMLSCFSRVWLFVTLWTVARQDTLSLARIQEWVSMPSPRGIFPTQGLNACLSCLLHWQVGSLTLVPPGKPIKLLCLTSKKIKSLWKDRAKCKKEQTYEKKKYLEKLLKYSHWNKETFGTVCTVVSN